MRKAQYTILADVPEQRLSIVGDADGKIMFMTDEYKATMAPELFKDAYMAQPGTRTFRVIVPPPIEAKLDPWTSTHPFAPLFEYEDIPIGVLDIGGFGLPCGFGKRSGVWVVGGKLERWEYTA
jgi:hypothetical protein